MFPPHIWSLVKTHTLQRMYKDSTSGSTNGSLRYIMLFGQLLEDTDIYTESETDSQTETETETENSIRYNDELWNHYRIQTPMTFTNDVYCELYVSHEASKEAFSKN